MNILAIIIWAVFIHQNTAYLENGSSKSEVDDVKEIFLTNIRKYEDNVEDTDTPIDYFLDIPQPGGFQFYQKNNERIKRDDGEKLLDNLENVDAIEIKNSQKLQNFTKAEGNYADIKSAVDINDFIRFKRADQGVSSKTGGKLVKVTKDESSGGFSQVNQQERTGKMLMQEVNIVPEGSREPRGATKEQWIKQPYPVRAAGVDDNNYEDNTPLPSDVRPPRVHFVTQRQLENLPPSTNTGNYEREGRTRDFLKDSPIRSLTPIEARKPDRNYYEERHMKNYEPYPPRPFYPYRDNPYYRYEESRFDPQYSPVEHDRYRPEYTNRQRRIIYYATLPEVVRSPPNVNLRDRYNYRDRYDDRYVSSPSLSVADRFRKPHPFAKPYDPEVERTKAPYPLKVSTDVNVRETKKNPERRIYSEPGGRYAFKASPYQLEEGFDTRT